MTETDDTTPSPAPTPELVAYAPTRRGGRWTVAYTDGSASEVVRPADGRDVRRVARDLGTDEAAIRSAVQAAEAALAQAAEEAAAAPPAEVEAWRGCETPTVYPDLTTALEAPGQEYLRWSADAPYCAVDVDLTPEGEAGGGWTDRGIEILATRAGPNPRWAWRSRSGGIRFVFAPDPDSGLSAVEMAGLWVLRSDACAHVWTEKVELVRVTRTPPGEWLEGAGGFGCSDYRGALLRTGGVDSVDAEQIEEWLAQRGLQRGQRYPHTQCPGHPVATRGNPPVVVGEDGIMCHRCGERWAWARLVEDPDAASGPVVLDPLVHMAQTYVHWAHARHVLAAARPDCDPRFWRAGYAALLRILHGEPEDPAEAARLAGIWSPAVNWIRSRGSWIRGDTLTGARLRDPVHYDLPWVGRNHHRAALSADSGPLDGFPAVEPVLHIAERPTWRADVVVIPHRVESAPPLGTLDLAGAEDQIRRMLPHVTAEWLGALRILVHAGIRGQYLPAGGPPIVVLTTVTGGGKGALLGAAAGILGRDLGYLRFDNAGELAMSIGVGLESGAPLLFGDEIGKVEAWWATSKPLLQASDVHHWRKLHTGDVRTPFRAAVILAGSTLPSGMTTMAELDRRSCYLELSGLTSAETGGWSAAVQRYLQVPRLEALREAGGGSAIAEAYIADARACVTEPLCPWPDHAERYGAGRLRDSDDAREARLAVETLYGIWRTAPAEAIAAEGARVGWLRGEWEAARAVLSAWIAEDASRGERYARVRTLETVVLPGGVTLRIRDHGRRLWIRFVSPSAPRSLDRTNPALFP